MVEFVLHALRSITELAVFPAIALGLLIGQIGLQVPTELKSVFS